MKLRWSERSLDDLDRLADFLADVAPKAALAARLRLTTAAFGLLAFPRRGAPVRHYDDRNEVRRLIVGDYELRYEIIGETIAIVRIWHTREDR